MDARGSLATANGINEEVGKISERFRFRHGDWVEL